MNKLIRCALYGAVLLGILALAAPLRAADKSEDELIADLSSSNTRLVDSALLNLEKHYPTSSKARPAIKKLLTDPRVDVQRKAARVLGSLHAEVSDDDVKAMVPLLKSKDWHAQTDGLKALRGLKAPQAIPDIVPLLKDPNTHIIRDACRTLAVLGDKSLVPSIEPLLKYPDPAVQKDAMDAIAALRAK